VNVNGEEDLLARFFVSTKRERYVEMISNPKKRQKFVRELAHFKSLDPRYLVSIPPTQQRPEAIASALMQKGAPQFCWVTSENQEIDGRQMLLADALKEVVGRQMGTIISCVPGRLAFFEGEEPGARWILERLS
jgi:hypothetical protein